MPSPRSKRTTAMRPCGPSPFSTLTKRRSMSRSSCVRAKVAPRLYKGEAVGLTGPHVEIDRLPFASNAASMRCSPATPSPARRAPSSPCAQGGEVEICKGYGLASIEHGVPITPQTRFRIASVSKQFTVTAALMLAAEGKLEALRSAAQVPARAEAAARHHRPDDAQFERPARLPRAAAAGRPRPRQAGARRRLSRRRRAQRPSQLRAGQPLPLQQHQLPAARA